jgi:hypothetical protein
MGRERSKHWHVDPAGDPVALVDCGFFDGGVHQVSSCIRGGPVACIGA